MKKNGFTLIELIVVIIIIALLMVLTIPNILKISRQTKEKAYDTKIEMIEKAAIDYGNDNKAYIMKGQTPLNVSGYHLVGIQEEDRTGKINSVVDAGNTPVVANESYSQGETTRNIGGKVYNIYRGNRITIGELVQQGYLNYDSENVCTGCGDDYDKVVTDPRNNYIINKCYVYMYYKYQRIYAAFDRATCDDKQANIIDGKEYAPKKN